MTHYRAALFLALTLACLAWVSHANAGIIDITDQQSGGVVTTPTGDLTFIPNPADLILYGANADFTNQSPGAIELDLEAATGVDLQLTGATEGLTGSSITIPFAANAYYLHYGDNGVMFGYNDRPDFFTITGLSSDLSNYRLYALDCDDGGFTTTTVAEPGAAALIVLGLLGVAVSRRRNA